VRQGDNVKGVGSAVGNHISLIYPGQLVAHKGETPVPVEKRHFFSTETPKERFFSKLGSEMGIMIITS
jgi:hypothetical protein